MSPCICAGSEEGISSSDQRASGEAPGEGGLAPGIRRITARSGGSERDQQWRPGRAPPASHVTMVPRSHPSSHPPQVNLGSLCFCLFSSRLSYLWEKGQQPQLDRLSHNFRGRNPARVVSRCCLLQEPGAGPSAAIWVAPACHLLSGDQLP